MASYRFFLNIGLGCILLLMLVGSKNVAAFENERRNLQSTIPGQGNETVDLGIAYHSYKKGFFGLYSVRGNEDITYGNTEIDFRVGIDLGFSDIYNMISGKVDVQVEFPVVSVGAGASLANETAADSYTGTYTLYTSITPKKKLLIPQDSTGYQPTAAALELANNYPTEVLENVGDEFVTCIEYGSSLLINMRIEYRNASEKNEIGGYLNVDWSGLVNVGGSLDHLDQNTKKSVKITIRAVQKGGNPIELFNIIPDGIMACTLDNPDPCFLVFENAVIYAKSDYLAQLTELSDYNVTRLFTNKYTESGPGLRSLVPYEGYPQLTYISQIALKNINKGWENAMLDKRRATNILQYYISYLTPGHKAILEDIKDKSRRNAFRFAGAAEDCLVNPYDDVCRNIELQTNTTIETYDRSYLNVPVM